MQVTELDRFEKDEGQEFLNPFLQDAFLMGTQIGKNVTIMYEKFDQEVQPYIIVINTKTGRRIRIDLESESE